MTDRINASSSSGNLANNLPDLQTPAEPENPQIRQAVTDLARRFQQQSTITASRGLRNQGSAFQSGMQFITDWHSIDPQRESLDLKLKKNSHDILLLPEVEEMRLVSQELLRRYRRIPNGTIGDRKNQDPLDILMYQVNLLLDKEIDLTTRKIHIEIAKDEKNDPLGNDGTANSVWAVKNQKKLDALKPLSKMQIECNLERHHSYRKPDAIKIIADIAFHRSNELFQYLCNYLSLCACSENHQSAFIFPEEIIAELVRNVNEYSGLLDKFGNRFYMQKNEHGEILNKEQPDSREEMEFYCKALPTIENVSEICISGLAHLITDSGVKPQPLFNEQNLLLQLNDLFYFSQKFSWAFRTMCEQNGWQELLEKNVCGQSMPAVSPSPAVVSDSQIGVDESTATSTATSTAVSTAESSSAEEATATAETEKPAQSPTRRVEILLKVCQQLLVKNPLDLVISTKLNPGFYSPASVQQLYFSFNMQADKTCRTIAATLPKIEAELQRETLNGDLKLELENYREQLSQRHAQVQQEKQYAQTDEFKFSILKLHKTPRGQHWRELIEKGEVESIVFKGQLPTDNDRDHLYEFQLLPKANLSGHTYLPAWLHVHLNRIIHKPAQWQSLERTDIRAAHLKPNHTRCLGVKWQDEQRTLGNYDAVVERSRVDLDFVKLVASHMEVSTETMKNQKKGKSRKR